MNLRYFRSLRLTIILMLLLPAGYTFAQLAPEDFSEDDIEIVQGEKRVIYEYRQNGILMMIKVVPDKGKPYYMVPADGSAHYETLDQKDLYPNWVIIEW